MKKILGLYILIGFAFIQQSQAQVFITSFGVLHNWGVPRQVTDVVYDHYYDFNWVHADRIYSPFGWDYHVILERNGLFAEVDITWDGLIRGVEFFDYYPLDNHVCDDFCGFHRPFFNTYHYAPGYRFNYGWTYVRFRPTIRAVYCHPFAYTRRARYYRSFSPFRFRRNYSRVFHRADHYDHSLRYGNRRHSNFDHGRASSRVRSNYHGNRSSGRNSNVNSSRNGRVNSNTNGSREVRSTTRPYRNSANAGSRVNSGRISQSNRVGSTRDNGSTTRTNNSRYGTSSSSSSRNSVGSNSGRSSGSRSGYSSGRSSSRSSVGSGSSTRSSSSSRSSVGTNSGRSSGSRSGYSSGRSGSSRSNSSSTRVGSSSSSSRSKSSVGRSGSSSRSSSSRSKVNSSSSRSRSSSGRSGSSSSSSRSRRN
ncbi:MAG: hypothetical protein AAFO69_00860 [Bacteroidota bacterium]